MLQSPAQRQACRGPRGPARRGAGRRHQPWPDPNGRDQPRHDAAAPRLRDLKDRRLYVLPGQEVPAVLQPLVGGTVKAGHVEAHWDELLRMATSIRAGTVTASAMLKRLAAYPRQNGLAIALREAGR